MPDPIGGRRTAVATVVAMILVLALVPSGVVAKDPPRIDHFMNAVGQVESGGRYHARNATSGAYGKYQIMPRNWRAWSRLYLGRPGARPTPQNQEIVARAKFTALYTWLGEWRVVAHWWLTGSKDPNPAHWTPFSRRYVDKVMRIMARAPGGSPPAASPPAESPPPVASAPAPALRVYQEASDLIAYGGPWSSAQAAGYAGGGVRYARTAGATATLRFSGTSVAWVGPVGPTRGRAQVLVDGALVATVELYNGSFVARRTLFSTSWAAPAGPHTLTIRVVGTRGRPMVAIDEFRVRG